MSSSSSSSSSGDNGRGIADSGQKANFETLAALRRLSPALADLDDRSSNSSNASLVGGCSEGHGRGGHGGMSHWRYNPNHVPQGAPQGVQQVPQEVPPQAPQEVPQEVNDGYQMLSDGAELVKATSTKYTLVGKINMDDGITLVQDLLRGCELLSTGALILHSPSAGLHRSPRHYVKRSVRAVVATVMNLIEVFVEVDSGGEGGALAEGNEQLAAQKCGAVWSACDGVTKVPKGNRNGMRRDLLVWAGECNETLVEFEELVELGGVAVVDEAGAEEDGGGEGSEGGGEGDDDGDEWDEFGGGTGHQYTASELPIARACLALIKCSRGTINATLKACECAGDEVGRCIEAAAASSAAAEDEDEGEDKQQRKQAVLNWIGTLHDMARNVGEGVTDLGCLMYPPLDVAAAGGENSNKLLAQVKIQRDAILAVNECILDAVPTSLGKDKQDAAQEIIPMSDEVLELSGKLQAACQKRYDEIEAGMKAAASSTTDS